MTPPSPTATKPLPPNVTLFKEASVPDGTLRKESPAADVRITPFVPTATHKEFAKTTERRSAVDGVELRIHFKPSIERRMTPRSPTATNCPSPNATDRR